MGNNLGANDVLLIKMFEAAKEVGNGRMSDKDYAKNYLNDGSHFVSNPLLRISPIDYSRFVSKINEKIRREYLHQSTGYTYREVSLLLGYSSHKQIQNFVGHFTKKITIKLRSQLAILYRVPPDWLDQHNINNEWVTYHFHHQGIDPITLELFMRELKEVTHEESWIKSFIIKGAYPDTFIFLRVECQRGNFLVECFNETANVSDFHNLSCELSNSYNCIYGNVNTVITRQKNAATICLANNQLFCVPVEFRQKYP